jgi:O-Antigen ligase
MLAADATGQRPTVGETFRQRLLAHRAVLLPAIPTVSLMLLWAAHEGGYNTDTWYWGALALLAIVAATLIALGPRRPPLRRASIVALAAFGCYLAWSYLTMAWAQTPGWALEGSNRTLLFVLVFALFLILPWTTETALGMLRVFVLGVGTIAIVMLTRFASGDHVQQLINGGRLTAPTGYFNSSVALFMINALLAIVLATRRELPSLLRGTLIAIAGASLQLCVIGQSRGWLFTLPLVVVVAIAVVPDRLRVAAAAVLPVVAALAPAHTLLHGFQGQSSSSLDHSATSAGRTLLLICAAILLAGTLIAWREKAVVMPSLSRAGRRRLGVVVAALALVFAGAGAAAATHGDPVGFVKRQWHGFSHPATATRSSGSHFAAVGSGRYDFWRVSLDALAAHPIGGLGQDNFADYYVLHARTYEEPRWTHSLEMRLLAHTGIVGFGLFAAFLIAAVAAALPALRRGGSLMRSIAAAAMLPLVVWLIHGSVDWFWEMPALTAPALGFLGMAASLGRGEDDSMARRQRRRRIPSAVPKAAGVLAFLAAVFVLAFPYLSVREVSRAVDVRQRNPGAALGDLATAADLNPVSPDPGRFGGALALQTGRYIEAERRFRQAIAREPGGWFAWFGDGLAASALGDSGRAHRDFEIAASINSRQPVVQQALASVNTTRPLTPAQALGMLVTT